MNKQLAQILIFIVILLPISLSCDKQTEYLPITDAETEIIQTTIEARIQAGNELRSKGKLPEASYEHLDALYLAESIEDTLNIINAMTLLGDDHKHMGILSEASGWYAQALDIYSIYKDSTSIQSIRNKTDLQSNLGEIMEVMGYDRDAETYYRKALVGEEKLENELGQAINSFNIASIITKKGAYDDAMHWFNRAYQHSNNSNSLVYAGRCHEGFGDIAYYQGDLITAEREYLISYQILKEEESPYWIEPCLALGKLNLTSDKHSRAYSFITEALDMAKEVNSMQHIAAASELLSNYYEKTGSYEDALNYYKQSVRQKDSLINLSSRVNIEQLKNKYQKLEYSNNIIGMIKDREKMSRKAFRSTLSAIIIAILTLSIIIIFTYVLRNKTKTNNVMMKLQRAKQDFFTNVTHELRTPLTIILGMTKNMKKKYGNNSSAEADIDAIIDQEEYLLDMVNKLLDIAKVKSAIGEPQWKHGDIDIMLQMEFESMKIYAEQNMISMDYLSEQSNLMMDFVPSYMKKIINNLISNAIKYTPRGGKVSVILEKEGENKVKISVIDNGQGISSNDLPHIFDAFYQGKNIGRAEGSGIGLALTKEMVEAMNGHIEVYSHENHGTSFIVFLPISHGNKSYAQWIPEKQKDEIVDKVSLTAEKQNNATILIVEDNPEIAKYEGGLLEEEYNVLYARNGQEALDMTKEYIPDVIVTDLMMPYMDGYELTQKVRSSVEISHIHIVVVSAKSGEEERVKAFKSGADSFISKPFNPDELLIVVSNALSMRATMKESYAKALHDGSNEISDVALDKDKQFLSKLNAAIFSNMANPEFSADNLANIMCLSQRQLSRKVKAVTGFDTTSYIRKARMSSARRLIVTTSLSIGEIVGQCGFYSSSYFTKLYKQEYGETPTGTRKQ